MALHLTQSSPVREDFTLLSEYNAQTPETFDGKRILHQLALEASLKVFREQYEVQAQLRSLSGGEVPASDPDGNVTITGIDVWVTNKYMVLFASAQRIGLTVYYPSITVTAQDGSEILLELNLSSPDTADEDIEVLQLRVLPVTVQYPEADTADVPANGATNGVANQNHAATALFKAISNCQELNPDPRLPGDEDEDGEDGGEWFDETAPGATGWITSENMADFMDENGNFRMPNGTTVLGDEEEEEAMDGVPDEAVPVSGSSRTRTAAELDADDGEDDESKWQRTG